jgi:lysophospholipase L1-like esterase
VDVEGQAMTLIDPTRVPGALNGAAAFPLGVSLAQPMAGPVGASLAGPDMLGALMQMITALRQLEALWSGLGMLGGLPAPSGYPAPASLAGGTESSAPGAQSFGPGGASGGIGPGNNVLVIGDSHTTGGYGEELDRQLRGTGAQVETFSSGGSTPDWWLDGTPTTAGSVSIGPDGREVRSGAGQAHATPRIQDLIAKYHPDTIVINMGQNLRGKSPAEVQRQVQELEQAAKAGGARIVWVGSPPTANDAADGGQQYHAYNSFLRNIATAGGARFIDSSQLVSRYQGSDGIHYDPAAGAAWADRVFQVLQGLG